MIRCQSGTEIVPRSGDNVNRINGSVIGNNGYDLPFSLPYRNTVMYHSGYGYKIDTGNESAAGFEGIMRGGKIVVWHSRGL